MSDKTKLQPVIQQASIDAVKRYHRAAKNSAAQMAVYAVLAGLELAQIKKALPHGEFLPFVEATFDFSIRAAQRYASLAEGIKNKALKNDTVSYLPLLDCAPSELSPAKAEQLSKLIHKASDGSTISQLYQEFGIAKAPQGSGTKGGGPGGKPKAGSMDEQLEAARKIAREDLMALANKSLRYGGTFTILDDDLIEAAHAPLANLAQAMATWLKTPKDKRKPYTIEEILNGMAKL